MRKQLHTTEMHPFTAKLTICMHKLTTLLTISKIKCGWKRKHSEAKLLCKKMPVYSLILGFPSLLEWFSSRNCLGSLFSLSITPLIFLIQLTTLLQFIYKQIYRLFPQCGCVKICDVILTGCYHLICYLKISVSNSSIILDVSLQTRGKINTMCFHVQVWKTLVHTWNLIFSCMSKLCFSRAPIYLISNWTLKDASTHGYHINMTWLADSTSLL